MTFASEIERLIAECGDEHLFAHVDDVPVTLGQLRSRMLCVAGELVALDVRPGSAVAVYGTNSVEWLDFWLAAPLAGATCVPINVAFRGDFLLQQLKEPKVQVLLCDAALIANVCEIADDLPDLSHVVIRGEVPERLDLPDRIEIMAATSLYGGKRQAPPFDDALKWNEPYCVFYTSGTTGPSKGAMVTQHYLLSGAHTLAEESGCDGADVLFGAMPLFHFGGSVGLLLTSLVSGAHLVLDSAFSPSRFWERITRYSATTFVGVGPMVMMIHSLPPQPGEAHSTLKRILAAPIPPALHHDLEKRFGARIRGVYGMTEVFPMCIQPFGEAAVPGSAGKPNPDFEMRLVDDDDNEVPAGQPGEIVCRPKRPHVMFEGYLNRADDTVAQLRNLWFHTGDMARIGDGGHLFFVDRKKDAIRRRGENISSFEIEATLLRHPEIVEVAAHAVASDLGEDDVKVCVVRHHDAPLDAPTLIEYCIDQLPRFAVPRYVEFVDALPKTVTGRVRKVELRAQGVGGNTYDRGAATAPSNLS